MTHHSMHFILLNDGSFTFGSMPQRPSTPGEHCKSCLTHTLACVCPLLQPAIILKEHTIPAKKLFQRQKVNQ